MSETEKPSEQPPAAETPAAGKPPREKPPERGGRVPSLEKDQSYGFGKRIDAVDEEMERQLQEAMSGMSEKDIYGEPQKPALRGKTPQQPGPKKGKVFRIHGQSLNARRGIRLGEGNVLESPISVVDQFCSVRHEPYAACGIGCQIAVIGLTLRW